MLANRIILAAGGSRLDRYTKSLLHFNGADGSTNFKDETGKKWTPYGNAQIDIAQSKFGGASGYFDGSSYIDTPYDDDFTFGSEDFTIDFWCKKYEVGTGSGSFIFAQCSSAGTSAESSILMNFDTSDNLRAYCYIGTNNYYLSVPFDSNWHHVELDRHGSNYYLFKDGVLAMSETWVGNINNAQYPFTIGKKGLASGARFKGWIDEFRISKGIARHTANFTPPTKEY